MMIMNNLIEIIICRFLEYVPTINADNWPISSSLLWSTWRSISALRAQMEETGELTEWEGVLI